MKGRLRFQLNCRPQIFLEIYITEIFSAADFPKYHSIDLSFQTLGVDV